MKILSPLLLSIFLMIISVGMLAGIDSIVIIVAKDGMHPFQIVFFRCLFGLAALTPLFVATKTNPLRSDRPIFHGLRGVIHSASMICWFIAITMIPLAEATVLSFTVPIYLSIGAIIFLAEPSLIRRWFAIVLGFIGVLVVLRPGFQSIGLGEILVIGSAILVATSKLMMKSLAKTDAPITIVFYMTLIVTITSFIPSLFFWIWPPLEIWLWLVFMGVGGSLAHVIQTHSYKLGEVTVVEAVSYVRLVWATMFGFILFNQFPDLYTWLGTAIIITGGILLTRSETRTANVTPQKKLVDYL